MSVFTEIPPLSHNDTFVIFERKKKNFDFPIHVHKELELNLIKGANGATRIVGDSIGTVGDTELVLIGGENLEHGWLNGNMRENREFLEVTLQFSPELFDRDNGLFSRLQFRHIISMLDKAKDGMLFSRNIAEKASELMEELIKCSKGFQSILLFLKILDTLALDPSPKILSNRQPLTHSIAFDSENIQKTMDYLAKHYKEKIKIDDVAANVNMSPSTFYRFLKKRTGKNFSDNVIDLRIALAAKALINSPELTISEIGFGSGFKNISNFNRQFKKRKKMTPVEFRNYYNKNKIII